MNDEVKLEDKQLPTIEDFRNGLHDEECAPEDYARGQKVWKIWEMKTFRDYHELYLRCIFPRVLIFFSINLSRIIISNVYCMTLDLEKSIFKTPLILKFIGDVLQLADVFEEFREVSKRIYDLDPAYYISAPQLS